jgi:hypothetical protein
MILIDYEVCHEEAGMVSATERQIADGITMAALADRRDLLSLLRARICLACAESRTGTFTECPMCGRAYPKDP